MSENVNSDPKKLKKTMILKTQKIAFIKKLKPVRTVKG